MTIQSNVDDYIIEMQDLIKLFAIDNQDLIIHEEVSNGELYVENFKIINPLKSKEFSYEFITEKELSDLRKKSIRKRRVKNYLYEIISNEYSIKLPWGSLTGVRPTKFARDLVAYGEAKEHTIPEIMARDYFVDVEKARLVGKIIKNQRGIIRNDNLVDIYVNIPICPTRCRYCSFISNELARVKDKVDVYLDCLIKEINCIKDIIKRKSYIVRNVYIGGGTPSVLSAEQLDRLLEALRFPVNEFTVECGRPDTITEEKLDVLKNHGVTRISINPQTFCEATLKRIGRKQKNLQVLNAYSMALEKDFIVNMDVIAGLPGEKLGIFKRTIKTLLELYPHNITVHTLSIKNGALLKNDKIEDKDVVKMIDFAENELAKNGYHPYYIYRQKNQLKGLENVGYYRDEFLCMFNVESMEETNSILGVGAGAISKRIFNLENRIERQANVKFIEDYIQRIDEMIEKKKEFYI